MQCRQLARGLTGILNPVAFSIVSCFSADFSFHGTRRACVMQHPCRRKACLMSMCVSPVRRLGSSIAGAAKKRNVFVKLCSASCRRDYYLPGDWRCKVIMLFQFFSVFFITTCSGNFAAAQWAGTGDARAMLKDVLRPVVDDSGTPPGATPTGDYQRQTQSPMVWLNMHKQKKKINAAWYGQGFAEEANAAAGELAALRGRPR